MGGGCVGSSVHRIKLRKLLVTPVVPCSLPDFPGHWVGRTACDGHKCFGSRRPSPRSLDSGGMLCLRRWHRVEPREGAALPLRLPSATSRRDPRDAEIPELGLPSWSAPGQEPREPLEAISACRVVLSWMRPCLPLQALQAKCWGDWHQAVGAPVLLDASCFMI